MPDSDQTAVTVDEFCLQRRMSKPLFYKLCARGEGPRLLKLGRLTRITPTAAAEFDAAHEEAAE
jgi:hypothetical protein